MKPVEYDSKEDAVKMLQSSTINGNKYETNEE